MGPTFGETRWPWHWTSPISDNGAELTNTPRCSVLTYHRVLTEAVLSIGCSRPVTEAAGYQGQETRPRVTGHDGSSALPNIRRTALCTRGPILTLCSQARLSPPSAGPSWLLSRNLPQSLVSSSPNKLTCVYLPQVCCSENLGSQVDTPNTSFGDKTDRQENVLLSHASMHQKWISDWRNLSPCPQSTHPRPSLSLTEKKATRSGQRD